MVSRSIICPFCISAQSATHGLYSQLDTRSTRHIIQGSSIGHLHHVVNTLQATFKQSHREIYWSNLHTYIRVNIRPPMPMPMPVTLDNVELWSRANNQKVNPAKCAEIIFIDKRRKTAVVLQYPLPIPNSLNSYVIYQMVSFPMTLNEH